MTPTTKSVDASKASKMFDLWALSRGFNFTEKHHQCVQDSSERKGDEVDDYDEVQHSLSQRGRLVKSSTQQSEYIATRGNHLVVG